MNDLKLNLDKIKARAPKVYDQLIGALALAGIHTTTGEVTITPAQWRHLSAVHGKLIPVLQQIVNEHDKYCGCNDCFNKYTAEIADSERKRLEPLNAAIARLQEYFKAGLVDSPENATIFDRAWREHPQLSKITTSSPKIVDAVIAVCRDKLAWRKQEPTPQPAQEPPQEPVFLSDGSPQKSLDETPNNSWTVAQCKDWVKRSGGQKLLRQQQYGGTSRSSWFRADSQVI